MKPTLKQIVRIRSLRFGAGCLFAIISLAASLYCYDNLKAGVLFAALFTLTGAILIQKDLIPPQILCIIYIGWFILTAFYGDHYPKLNDEFYEEVHGGAFDSLNDQMLQYEVPFFIWTNYETASAEIELTSMNYLSGFLYQRANLEMPEYNQYLEQVRQLIPACNSLGYYSYDAGQFLALDDAQGEEKKKLLEYGVEQSL